MARGTERDGQIFVFPKLCDEESQLQSGGVKSLNNSVAQHREDCASGFCWKDHTLIHCATSDDDVTGLIK